MRNSISMAQTPYQQIPAQPYGMANPAGSPGYGAAGYAPPAYGAPGYYPPGPPQQQSESPAIALRALCRALSSLS